MRVRVPAMAVDSGDILHENSLSRRHGLSVGTTGTEIMFTLSLMILRFWECKCGRHAYLLRAAIFVPDLSPPAAEGGQSAFGWSAPLLGSQWFRTITRNGKRARCCEANAELPENCVPEVNTGMAIFLCLM